MKKIVFISLSLTIFTIGFISGAFFSSRLLKKNKSEISFDVVNQKINPTGQLLKINNNQDKSSLLSPTNKILSPALNPSPTNNYQDFENLPKITISYQPKTDWATYEDKIAGFSFQYQNKPIEALKFYQEIRNYEYGKFVEVFSCFTPPTGPAANHNICSIGYKVSIYDNYDGGSRRVWFKNNVQWFNQCNLPLYYADIYLSNIKGLLITSECSSSFGTSHFIFPKGNLMIVVYYDGLSFDINTKKIKIDDYFYQRLATFKFN